MSEIEKIYENAGLHKRSYIAVNFNDKIFTAEKQLELIKWLAKRLDFGLEYYHDKWVVQTQLGWDGYEEQFEHKNFEEALSGLINHIWQELTEEDKQQIKEILE